MTEMDLVAMLFTFPVLVILLGGVWLSGYRSRFKRIPGLRRSPEREYFIGLNYLLNDEPDDAIDIFISALEVSSATLETHIALATLLRRRGKVDRAIAHCQKLLESSQFAAEQRAKIELNLVRSYIAAGLLDRAEHLLAGLKKSDGGVREAALELAITVFQKEKEWQLALDAAVELLDICPALRHADLQLQSSHFHCELAEIALGLGDFEQARGILGSAAAVSRANVRIHFLLARVDAAQGAWQESVQNLQKIPDHYPDFAGEACAPLLRALQAAGMEKQLMELLDTASEGGIAAGTYTCP
jgi:lipopolysaccharide biosynthesis regulator YciM